METLIDKLQAKKISLLDYVKTEMGEEFKEFLIVENLEENENSAKLFLDKIDEEVFNGQF